MDFNPDDAHHYFEGVDYPASKEDPISAAEANGAPDTLVDRIGTLAGPSSPARRTSWRSYTLLLSRPDHDRLLYETQRS